MIRLKAELKDDWLMNGRGGLARKYFVYLLAGLAIFYLRIKINDSVRR